MKLKWTLCNKIKSVIRLNPSETHSTIQFEAIENSLCPFISNYNPLERYREKSCLSNDQRVGAMKASISTELQYTATMCISVHKMFKITFKFQQQKNRRRTAKQEVFDLQIFSFGQGPILTSVAGQIAHNVENAVIAT